MKMLKIIIGISILFLCLGAVSAAHMVDVFTAPSGLEPAGYNSFVDLKGHNIMMSEYSDDDYETWFVNDTDYLVQKYNDTCYIGVDDENDCYILEIVEKDGTKYLISSWTPNGPEETNIIQHFFEEFNKVNHLTPLKLDEVLP